MYTFNFYHDRVIISFPGSYVYLIVEIISNPPLTSIPMWSRFNAKLPTDHHVENYSKGGKNFTSLIIDKVSSDDRGFYYLNASNRCGTSFIKNYFIVLSKGKNNSTAS